LLYSQQSAENKKKINQNVCDTLKTLKQNKIQNVKSCKVEEEEEEEEEEDLFAK